MADISAVAKSGGQSSSVRSGSRPHAESKSADNKLGQAEYGNLDVMGAGSKCDTLEIKGGAKDADLELRKASELNSFVVSGVEEQKLGESLDKVRSHGTMAPATNGNFDKAAGASAA